MYLFEILGRDILLMITPVLEGHVGRLFQPPVAVTDLKDFTCASLLVERSGWFDGPECAEGWPSQN